jgi:hypothetical protein
MYFSQPRSKHNQFKKLIHKMKRLIADHEGCKKGNPCQSQDEHQIYPIARVIIQNLEKYEPVSSEVLSVLPEEFQAAIQWYLELPRAEQEAAFAYYDIQANKKQFHRKKSKSKKGSIRA